MTGARTRGWWWEEYRELLPVGLLDLAEVEHHATYVRVATTVHIPGLLQTTEHARVVFNAGIPQLAPYEVEHRISHRIKRQAILHGDAPTPLTAIVHEAALRMGYGGSTVARGQLQHLIDMGEREYVTVVVIPFGAGPFPGSGQSVDYLGAQYRRLIPSSSTRTMATCCSTQRHISSTTSRCLELWRATPSSPKHPGILSTASRRASERK